MKRILTILFAAAITLTASAQGRFGADSAECVKYLSYYKEYLKHNNNADAIGPWRSAYAICPPTASQNMLIDGQKLMRWAYNKSKDAKERQGYLDTLMQIYDLRIANYPKGAVSAMNNKVIDIVNFKWKEDDPEAVYNEVKSIFAATGARAKDLVFVKFMEASANLYAAGKISAENVIEDYSAISDKINEALTVDARDGARLAKAQKDVETLFMNSGVASCDNMIALLQPRYEANPNDEEVLRSVVKMLSAADCLDSDLYVNAVESLYTIDPTSSTAYLLYKLFARKDDTEKAVEFLQKAIDTSTGDAEQLASYYLELGSYNYKTVNNNAAAVAAAKKAAELSDAYKGRAYLLIGTIWGTSRCGGSEVAAQAHFWVAYDYVNRAKAADESLTEEANSLASQYQAYFPTQADAFMYDLTNGQSYTAVCGTMRETTTVRTTK